MHYNIIAFTATGIYNKNSSIFIAHPQGPRRGPQDQEAQGQGERARGRRDGLLLGVTRGPQQEDGRGPQVTRPADHPACPQIQDRRRFGQVQVHHARPEGAGRSPRRYVVLQEDDAGF